VGQFVACLGERVCAVFWAVCSVFGGVSVYCVWESLVRVWGSRCVLLVGEFSVGLW